MSNVWDTHLDVSWEVSTSVPSAPHFFVPLLSSLPSPMFVFGLSKVRRCQIRRPWSVRTSGIKCYHDREFLKISACSAKTYLSEHDKSPEPWIWFNFHPAVYLVAINERYSWRLLWNSIYLSIQHRDFKDQTLTLLMGFSTSVTMPYFAWTPRGEVHAGTWRRRIVVFNPR